VWHDTPTLGDRRGGSVEAQEAKPMDIRVEEIRKLERGSLRGFATVNVGGIRISHIKIIQPEGNEPFIQMPQRSYQMNKGGRRYSNVVDLPDELTREVEKAVLSLWKKNWHASPLEDEHGAQSA